MLSAVLLFALICMGMAGVVPPWPMALVMGLGAAAVFAVLYRFLFLFWMGGTPGNWLAGLTGDEWLETKFQPMSGPDFGRVMSDLGRRTSDLSSVILSGATASLREAVEQSKDPYRFYGRCRGGNLTGRDQLSKQLRSL